MGNLWQDLRYGVRVLAKSPGFTAVAIITLALGIGANTAIFSLINAIMLRSLPVKDPQSLVILRWSAHRAPETKDSYRYDNCPQGRASLVSGRTVISNTTSDAEGCSFSYPLFQQIQAERKVFSSVLAFVPAQLTVNANRRTSQVQGLLVSGNFFSMLGTRPEFGRLLNPADDSDAAIPAIVVSHRFWQSELGGDRAVVGKPVLVGKTLFTVVGVAGSEFLELDPGLPTDLWLPLASQPIVASYLPKKTMANAIWLELMARLRPGVNASQATSATSALFAATVTNGPEAMFKPTDGPWIELPTAAYGLATLRKNFSQPLLALLLAVTIVLLIACANMAGLMLARASARQKEMAVRSALAASRGRIVRQLLTESLLLSGAGGIAGVLLGNWGAEALAAFLTRNWFVPLRLDAHVDLRVLAFTGLISVLVGLIFGIVPAFSTGQVELVPALKEGVASSASASWGNRTALGDTLVVVQMALAMLILVGAGLLVRTLANLKAENVGFDPRNLVLFGVDTSYSNRTGGNLKVLNHELQEQLTLLPGVTSISYSAGPLLSGSFARTLTFAEDRPASPIPVNLLPVTPNFFKTMRVPLVAGRTFDAEDSEEKQPGNAASYQPAVINEKLAHSLFGSQAPIGRLFRMGGSSAASSTRREVVGVVGDTKDVSLRDAVMPTIYSAAVRNGGNFEIRTAMDPKALMPAVRAAVARFDPNLLVTGMKTQMEQIDQNIYQERLIANLSSLFALLALIVACVGIYGLLSYQVSRRTHEIGIRVALGAQRGDVLRIVLRQGAILATSGALIGVGAALGVTRYLQSFLFGVKPSDPMTIVAVAFGLIAVALLASYIPARRAMKTDPMVALRYE